MSCLKKVCSLVSFKVKTCSLLFSLLMFKNFIFWIIIVCKIEHHLEVKNNWAPMKFHLTDLPRCLLFTDFEIYYNIFISKLLQMNGANTLHILSHSAIPQDKHKKTNTIFTKKYHFSCCHSNSENELLTTLLKKM